YMNTAEVQYIVGQKIETVLSNLKEALSRLMKHYDDVCSFGGYKECTNIKIPPNGDPHTDGRQVVFFQFHDITIKYKPTYSQVYHVLNEILQDAENDLEYSFAQLPRTLVY